MLVKLAARGRRSRLAPAVVVHEKRSGRARVIAVWKRESVFDVFFMERHGCTERVVPDLARTVVAGGLEAAAGGWSECGYEHNLVSMT